MACLFSLCSTESKPGTLRAKEFTWLKNSVAPIRVIFRSSLMLVPEILSTYSSNPFLMTQAPQERLVPSLFPFSTFCSSWFQASLYLESFSPEYFCPMGLPNLWSGISDSYHLRWWYIWPGLLAAVSFYYCYYYYYYYYYYFYHYHYHYYLYFYFLLSLQCFALPCTFRQCKHLFHHVADILFHPLPIPWVNNSIWNGNTNCKHLKQEVRQISHGVT